MADSTDHPLLELSAEANFPHEHSRSEPELVDDDHAAEEDDHHESHAEERSSEGHDIDHAPEEVVNSPSPVSILMFKGLSRF